MYEKTLIPNVVINIAAELKTESVYLYRCELAPDKNYK